MKRKCFAVMVTMGAMAVLLYEANNDSLTMVADAFGKLKSSASFLAASVDDIQQNSIAKFHIVLDASTTNKTYRRKSFHSNEYVTEEEALKDPPLTDVRMTVSVARSSIQLKGNRHSYITGENIELQILLRDDMGIIRKRGGDNLRARMYNSNQGAYIAGHVTDHDNGSYTATLNAIWPGNQTISVYLAYSREAIHAIYNIRKQIQGTRTIDAIFMKGTEREDTTCHSERRWLTNYTDVCNLTLNNGGMSWYCGKPKNRLLSCMDWSFTKYGSLPVLPLTVAENQIFKPTWELFQDIYVEVKGKLKVKDDLPSCHSYPRHLLWSVSSATGYFYNNKWNLLHCHQPNKSVYTTCLRGKHLMISGDSTTRQWYKFLKNHMNCSQISEQWTTEKWHRKSSCVVPSMNLKIDWIPHVQPFMPGKDWDMNQYDVKCIAKEIADIRDKPNVIFVIHMHMHFTAFHHSIFQDRMQHISNSVRNVLKENKNVTFVIKGSHTYKIPGNRCNRLNDYFGYVYKDIMFNEFEGLHDKIVFMDQAAMTTAKGLRQNHPPQDVVKEAVFQMLDYVCKDSPSI